MPTIEGSFRRWLVCSVLIGCLSAACQQKPRLTAEEAGYDAEIRGVVGAVCMVGKTYSVQVGARQTICGGFAANCQGVFETVPIYETRVIEEMGVPAIGSEQPKSWSAAIDSFSSLLPPSGEEDVHSALLTALQVQASLDSTDTAQRSQRLPELRRAASKACKCYQSFKAAVAARPTASSALFGAPTVTLSYKPINTPFNISINNHASFSVSVSDSIATPIGDVGVSVSESPKPIAYPKRLVIRTRNQRRVFLLDRPFRVVVPTDYGVTLDNVAEAIEVRVAESAQDIAQAAQAGGG